MGFSLQGPLTTELNPERPNRISLTWALWAGLCSSAAAYLAGALLIIALIGMGHDPRGNVRFGGNVEPSGWITLVGHVVSILSLTIIYAPVFLVLRSRKDRAKARRLLPTMALFAAAAPMLSVVAFPLAVMASFMEASVLRELLGILVYGPARGFVFFNTGAVTGVLILAVLGALAGYIYILMTER